MQKIRNRLATPRGLVVRASASRALSIVRRFIFAAVVVAAGARSAAADQGQIKAELLTDKEVFQPPRSADAPVGRIGVRLMIAEGWHTYWRNSGEAAIPTKIQWELPAGWRAGELEWPIPERFLERGNIITYGYSDEVLLYAPLYAPTIIPGADEALTFKAKVSWLVCKEICVPGSAAIERSLSFSASRPEQPSKDYNLFTSYESLMPKAGSPVQTASSVRVVASGERTDAGVTVALLLTGTPPVKEPEVLPGLLQVFPYDALPGKTIEPELAVGSPGSEASALIRFTYPAKAMEKLPAEKPLRGILAVSRNLTGLQTDTALLWELRQQDLTPAGGRLIPPGAKFVPLTFRVESHREPLAPAPMVQRAEDTSLAVALLFAFVGGLILNLMPCVLPIISIKIMGFVEAGSKGRGAALLSSVFFSLGILASVLTLALVIVSLRSFGYSLGWGFQFQHPSFVFALTAIVFVLSLSFFDLYTIELPGLNKANKLASALTSDQAKSFFDGVLATALSTPCTAPFLGSALVFAFSQPPYATILVFLAIGVGLALPYMILATSPRLTGLLPKPGGWMFRFRQFLGFLMLATVLWLIFVLHSLTNLGAIWAAAFLLVLFFCLWLIRGFGDERIKPGPVRLLVAALILAFAGVKIYPRVVVIERAQAKNLGAAGWKDFSNELVSTQLAEGHPVFIDFTASWCLTCKANELAVIDTNETYQRIRELNIVPVRADWTSGDAPITEALKRYGAEGVPLYVIIPPAGGQPIVLSGIISKSSLYKAFDQAAGKL